MAIFPDIGTYLDSSFLSVIRNPKGSTMKIIISIVLAFTALLSMPVIAQNNQAAFFKEVEIIADKVEAGEKSQSEGAKEIFSLSKSYFPNDKLIQSFYQSLLLHSERLEKKLITQKEFDSLGQASLADYKSAISARTIESAKAQFQAALENDRPQRGQYTGEMLMQQEYTNPANTAAIATMLNGIGRAFTNSFGQSITPPPRICNYYGGTSYCF
ncbi:hypothetical protein ICN11_08380 [Polynucleobacter sp. 78F-HAINBA]|uniref:hypothetical protein n=1 Tax=Polynucleobacter sp. 78F-HAINBA TaxID=2689099 RepID=UPI001C0B1017|nr:hypothetical protein [Polynucleobacter sp. 78F-HAINBA]MBU3592031.1 hypothetical protein [Polynucleobacter sp. 78F-HAINBA]